MNDKEERIRSFFRAYEQRFNDTLKDPPVVDIQGLVDCFAKFFVAADPKGVRGGKNSLAFRWAIPHGFEFYRKIGMRSMAVTGVEIIPLGDDLHFVAKVGWDSRYTKKDGEEVRIDFVNTYFVRVEDEEPKIFGYVTGDEKKVLQEHGLI